MAQEVSDHSEGEVDQHDRVKLSGICRAGSF